MTTVADVLAALDAFAPVASKESWDNVGLLVGRRERAVHRIVVTLDITPQVIAEAAAAGAELIVSHHPVIFNREMTVTSDTLQGQKVLTLAEHGIAAICMHTNLDLAVGGVDDTLVRTLGFTPGEHLGADGIGHVVTLDAPMALAEFLHLVGERLGCNGIRYTDGGRPVQKIATGCGSCGDYLPDVIRAGCDTFVSSDFKYSVFLDGVAAGLNMVDAGHFSTENPICDVLLHRLRAAFPALQIEKSAVMAQPDRYFIPKNG